MNPSFSNCIRLLFGKAGGNTNAHLNCLETFGLSEGPKGAEVLFPKSSHYATLSPLSSIFVIALVFVTIIYGLLSAHPFPYNENKAGEDLRCYRRIIERIHAGEPYYKAAGSELRTRGYPTSSVFNWRLPTLAWFMGQLPTPDTSRILATLLAFLTLLIWISVFLRACSFPKILFGTFLLLSPPIYSLLPEIYLAHEFWAGALITLSLGTYARGWRAASLAAGILALFLRELTLPFACIMMVVAYWEGRRREAFLWLLGILAFGLMLSYHALVVKGLPGPGDPLQEGGWLVFGGLPFVLSATQMHPYLFLAPSWVTSIILPLSILGFLGWQGSLSLRVTATVGLFIFSFLFVGKDFNRYWGLMYVNIMLLGLMFVPSSFRDLFKTVCRYIQKDAGKR